MNTFAIWFCRVVALPFLLMGHIGFTIASWILDEDDYYSGPDL